MYVITQSCWFENTRGNSVRYFVAAPTELFRFSAVLSKLFARYIFASAIENIHSFLQILYEETQTFCAHVLSVINLAELEKSHLTIPTEENRELPRAGQNNSHILHRVQIMDSCKHWSVLLNTDERGK